MFQEGTDKRKERYYNMEKMTRKAALEIAIAAVESAEVKEVLSKMVEQLEKKAATPAKPDARTVENASLKLEILSILTAIARPMNIPEVVSMVTGDYANPVTNGRVSALLSALVKAGKVERTEVKRIAHFAIKEEVAEE